jgi:hypothetical protein
MACMFIMPAPVRRVTGMTHVLVHFMGGVLGVVHVPVHFMGVVR